MPCILYEIMTGRPPSRGESTHAVMMQQSMPCQYSKTCSTRISRAGFRRASPGLGQKSCRPFPTATALAESTPVTLLRYPFPWREGSKVGEAC